jgi:hypothetical protein
MSSAGSWAAAERADGTVRAGGMDRPSCTKSHPAAGSLSSSQPGGPPCWTNPLAFGLIGGGGGGGGPGPLIPGPQKNFEDEKQ